jgi:lysophospholipase L1-like esterase
VKPVATLLGGLTLLGLAGCGQGPIGETSNIEIRALNMALMTVASKYNCVYLDTYAIMLGSNGKPLRSLFQHDGEHLSELGYLQWSDAILVPYIGNRKVTCAGMLGDSITRRVASVRVANGTRDAIWDDLLGIKAYNQGVDGETSADVIRRMNTVLEPDIDCFFLMIGNNDLHAGVPIQDIIANVETIVSYLAVTHKKKVAIQAVMPLVEP